MAVNRSAVFLVVTGLLLAALLVALGWRARAAGLASWVLAISVIVAATTVLLTAAFAKGMTEGRLQVEKSAQGLRLRAYGLMICNAALAFDLGFVAAVLSMARGDDPASASTSFLDLVRVRVERRR